MLKVAGIAGFRGGLQYFTLLASLARRPDKIHRLNKDSSVFKGAVSSFLVLRGTKPVISSVLFLYCDNIHRVPIATIKDRSEAKVAVSNKVILRGTIRVILSMFFLYCFKCCSEKISNACFRDMKKH